MGTIIGLFYELLIAAIGLAALYFVVKAAIKAAIRELKNEKLL